MSHLSTALALIVFIFTSASTQEIYFTLQPGDLVNGVYLRQEHTTFQLPALNVLVMNFTGEFLTVDFQVEFQKGSFTETKYFPPNSTTTTSLASQEIALQSGQNKATVYAQSSLSENV